MRPKKVILLLEPDASLRSVRMFLLETKGFRVLAAVTPEETMGVLESRLPGALDVLAVKWTLAAGRSQAFIARARELHPELRVLLFAEPGSAGTEGADTCLRHKQLAASELIGVLTMLSARKRGPKRHPVSAMTGEVAA